MPNTLWLITARAGSKGVPGKNLLKIGGKSLIQWKCDAARPLVARDDLFAISTDSEEMAAEANRWGIQMAIPRPVELATDRASSASVIQHALSAVGGSFEKVVLLEPSAPFATTAHFQQALDMMAAKNAHLIVGMKRVEPSRVFVGEQPDDGCVTPIIVRMDRAGKNLRRQDLRDDWSMNGALYLFDTKMFLQTFSIYGGARNYGLLMDWAHSIEIDTPHDLEMAEYVYSKGYVGC